ncbi:uncharacterized protein LOC110710763 [Chenopodium quinoa]|uniref:uncharacterized protein LOC110710763 n=1 Tax=Chenopodium quinoa TaxID=63459 RepID=UPI000B77366A|nr:uncharacterized protein LOC110710763 [Chenopodium quinoa]
MYQKESVAIENRIFFQSFIIPTLKLKITFFFCAVFQGMFGLLRLSVTGLDLLSLLLQCMPFFALLKVPPLVFPRLSLCYGAFEKDVMHFLKHSFPTIDNVFCHVFSLFQEWQARSLMNNLQSPDFPVHSSHTHSAPSFISWASTPLGFCKLNFDGSSSTNSATAGKFQLPLETAATHGRMSPRFSSHLWLSIPATFTMKKIVQ